MANIFDLFRSIEKKEDPTPISAIVVGLGNPGHEYENTRHNAGFVAVDYIAHKCGVKIDRAKFHALTAQARIGDSRVLLMKPQTFMNSSGIAVGEAAAFYKVPPESVIVLCDDISLDPGIIRLRRKGSSGGHNGLKSIISHLPGENFPRVKIGIGKKPSQEYDLADWVLGKMSEDDLAKVRERLADIEESVRLMLDGKIDEAMSKHSK